MKRYYIIAAVLTVLWLSWLFRYNTVPVESRAYQVDRWTGNTYIIYGNAIRRQVTDREPIEPSSE